MHIKEYRIALPMTVEEYRIAQLYMIQRKSREESRGAGSGVEIGVNEPYTNGPGGCGQYTYKIYHIGSHLPGWFRAILPKSALRVEEEAWNAYPYTKTRYRCPFIEKFSLEIETRYLNDGGEQDNLFNISAAELRHRTVDYLDIVKDHMSSHEYLKEEDPTLYVSQKTQRGPLSESWWSDCSEGLKRADAKTSIMTAYKLCRVEFKYWGMQSKIERWIHDIGLRKTMLRAHRQAWCWQDEWVGLQLSDIRRLELETQRVLAATMAEAVAELVPETVPSDKNVTQTNQSPQTNSPALTLVHANGLRPSTSCDTIKSQETLKMSSEVSTTTLSTARRPSWGSRISFESTSRSLGEINALSLEQLQESSSEEEFFDAQEDMEKEMLSETQTKLMRSSSMEIVAEGDDDLTPPYTGGSMSYSEYSLNLSNPSSTHTRRLMSLPSTHSSQTSILFLVFHSGSVMDGLEQPSKSADFTTFKSTFTSVMKAHYPSACNRIAFRLVACPSICNNALKTLASLSPYSHDIQHDLLAGSGVSMTQEFIPLGAIALLSTAGLDYVEHINTVINHANAVYSEFLKSEEGLDFRGQVCLLADSTASLIAYDSLCRSSPHFSRFASSGSQSSLNDIDFDDIINYEPSFPNEETQDPFRKLSQSNVDLYKDSDKPSPAPVFDSPKQRSRSETVPPKIDEFKDNRQRQTDQIFSEDHIERSNADKQPVRTYSQKTDRTSSSDKQSDKIRLHVQCPSRRTSCSSQVESCYCKLDFDVSEFFLFGSPLALVLAFRQSAGYFSHSKTHGPLRPKCQQVYNLSHARDPCSTRLEPLINHKFRHISTVHVPRYSKFPLGDGEPIHVVETIQSNSHLFSESRLHTSGHLQRQGSINSIGSQVSGFGDLTISSITSVYTETVTHNWWGNKRLDYSLYCPDALTSFPANALPHLFHGSYWESTDVAAFILRQVVRLDNMMGDTHDTNKSNVSAFTPTKPREKWLRRRTTIKVKNLTPNHRANDIILLEDQDQVFSAKFMYGPLDMTALTGEKIDVYVMSTPGGEWVYLGTDMTDSHGRVTYTIPSPKHLTQGMYPIKMIVRGDHTSADFYLAVLPPKTQTVIFSIDGSFTASVSIMGKDPKVKAGAVDVVRHWQELGYLILYVTARPDMQQKKVTAWLAQHNFPHGMVAFMDGLSKEPLRQKLNYLKALQVDAKLDYQAAYGSSKDISMYKELQLTAQQIYCVGKASKKLQTQSQVLVSGYASHLSDLTTMSVSRPAVGNARVILRKSCFRLPPLGDSKKLAKRTNSMPHRCHPLDTTLTERQRSMGGVCEEGGDPRARGVSPRSKARPPRPQ